MSPFAGSEMQSNQSSGRSPDEKPTQELLAILAHQIRNPLAAVVNGVHVLRQSGTTGAVAEQTLDLIERQLQQVIQLVGEILQPDSKLKTSGSESEPTPYHGPASGPLKLLVVEDNRDVAKSLASMLRLWGHEVYVGYDGVQALSLAAQHRPQVALLDLDLPGLDGYAVARRLRASSQVHLVAITASGDENHRRLTREAGFESHLVKPVAPSLLKQLLASLGADHGQ